MIVGRVRSRLGSIEDVIGTEKKQASALLPGGLRDVHGAAAVHIEGQIAVGLAAIDIGVRRRQDDPVRLAATDQIENALGITDVAIGRTEPCHTVVRPFGHQGFAQESSGAEDCDSHAADSLRSPDFRSF